MRILKADDYQTWFIEENNFSILVDPWLDKKLNPHSSLILQREREDSSCLSKEDIRNVDAVIITAPFVDHMHFPSLNMLNKDIQIFTTKKAKKILNKKGFLNIKTCINYHPIKIGPFLLSPYPAGFPYTWSSFCFFLENKNKKSVYHESHISNFSILKANNQKCDLALITIESVKIFGLLTLSMGLKQALKTASLLGAKKIMATGTNPKKLKGIIKRALLIKESKVNKLKEGDPHIFYKSGDEVIL
ncbi:MAG: MBL fold metallo-hydrolase [Alphaproteobacteria bacterium]